MNKIFLLISFFLFFSVLGYSLDIPVTDYVTKNEGGNLFKISKTPLFVNITSPSKAISYFYLETKGYATNNVLKNLKKENFRFNKQTTIHDIKVFKKTDSYVSNGQLYFVLSEDTFPLTNSKEWVFAIEHSYPADTYFEFDSSDDVTTYTFDPDLTSCGTISSPGYYTLINNVISTGQCFTIGAANVILDCQNYNISVTPSAAVYVIYNSGGFANTTVRNCNIYINNASLSSAYASGVRFHNVDTSIVENTNIYVNVSRYANGVYISGSTRNVTVRNVTINSFSSNTPNLLFAVDNQNFSVIENSMFRSSAPNNLGTVISQNFNTTVRNNIFNLSRLSSGINIGQNSVINNNTFFLNFNNNENVNIITARNHTRITNNTFISNSTFTTNIYAIMQLSSFENNISVLNNSFFNTSRVRLDNPNNIINMTYLYNITLYNIFDTNDDGYGDIGSDYPLSSYEGIFFGNEVDYFPRTTKRVEMYPPVITSPIGNNFLPDTNIIISFTDSSNYIVFYNVSVYYYNGTKKADVALNTQQKTFQYNVTNESNIYYVLVEATHFNGTKFFATSNYFTNFVSDEINILSMSNTYPIDGFITLRARINSSSAVTGYKIYLQRCGTEPQLIYNISNIMMITDEIQHNISLSAYPLSYECTNYWSINVTSFFNSDKETMLLSIPPSISRGFGELTNDSLLLLIAVIIMLYLRDKVFISWFSIVFDIFLFSFAVYIILIASQVMSATLPNASEGLTNIASFLLYIFFIPFLIIVPMIILFYTGTLFFKPLEKHKEFVFSAIPLQSLKDFIRGGDKDDKRK